MSGKVLYRDRAGNTVSLDSDGRLALRNRQGGIVNPEETRRYFKRPWVVPIIKRGLGIPEKGRLVIRLLTPKQTRKLGRLNE